MHVNPSPIELTTAGTDAALGLVAIALVAWLAGRPPGPPFKKSIWISVFALLAIGSVLGTVAHGLALSPTVVRQLWQPLYLSLGLCVAMFFVGAVREWKGERRARAVLPWAVAAGLALFAATQLADDFRIFIAYEAVAMVGTLLIYASVWIARRSLDAALMTLGIALTLAAAAVQVSSFIIWPFDHNGLFHVVQIAAILVMAGGLSGRTAPAHVTTENPNDLIRRAAAIARDAGLVDEANELESVTWQAYTTSSEMAGVLGGAIRAFQSRASARVPRAAAELLDAAVADIQAIWPDM